MHRLFIVPLPRLAPCLLAIFTFLPFATAQDDNSFGAEPGEKAPARDDTDAPDRAPASLQNAASQRPQEEETREIGVPAQRTEDTASAPRNRARPADTMLEAIVVTATTLEEENYYVPYSAASLDGATLTSRRGVRTLPEALRDVPGVMVQKTGHGQGSPFIRGFTGFRTLLLIDGIRLNNAVFRDGPNQYWNTVDPLTIDRLEVIKGPSSVLYGSDAIGGTVNAITRGRKPFASGGVSNSDFDWTRRAYYRFASAEDSHVARGELSAAYGPYVGVLGGFSYRDFGNLSGGRHTGVMPNTGYDELDGDVKAIFRLQPDLDLVLAFQGVDQEKVPRTHSTIFSKSFRGTEVGTDQKRDLHQRRYLGYAQLHWKPDLPWLSRLTFSTSYQFQEEEEERIRSNLRERRQGFEDGTFGTWMRLESPSPIGTLTYGIEYYRDEVDSFFREFTDDGSLRVVRPRGPVADDSSYDLLGIYVQDSFRPLERLEVVIGGRFSYAHAEADEVDPDPTTTPDFGPLNEDFSGAVGSVRLLYEATEWCNLFGGVSQGFRAPNLSDLTRFDVARSGELEIPAPNLDPEDYVSFEAGSKFLVEDWGLQAYASYHYTLIDGMIVRFPTGDTIDGDPVVTKDNIGDGFVHGVELGLAWNFYRDFTAFGNFTWLEGEADTFVGNRKSSEPLSRIQPATALLGVRWTSPERRYWVEAAVTIVGNQDRLSPRDEADTQRIPPGGTPGYTVYALRGGAEVIDGLKLFAAVENITDVDHRVHGSGQNEPGTNVILGADWTF